MCNRGTAFLFLLVSLPVLHLDGWIDGWMEEFCTLQSMSLRERIGIILLLPALLAVLHGRYPPLMVGFQQKVLVLFFLKGYHPHPQHFISSHVYIL